MAVLGAGLVPEWGAAGDGGSQPVIGTSVLIASGAGQGSLTAGFQFTISYTLDSILGSDLEIDGGDDTAINVLTAGWYQATVHLGVGATADVTAEKVNINMAGVYPYDHYVAIDGVNAGGGDITLTTPVMYLPAGGVGPSPIRVSCGTDGSGSWNIEATPNQLVVVRLA